MSRASSSNILVIDNTLSGKIVDDTSRADGYVIYFDTATDTYKHAAVNPATGVPYSGAVLDVDLGTHKLTAGTAKVGGVSDYTEFEADGTIKFVGAATVFSDLNPSSVTIGSGGSAPSFTVYNLGNLRAYEFVGSATVKELNMMFQISHGYKEGSDIVPHLHLYVPDDGTGGIIRFGFEYVWVNVGSTGAIATTTIYNTITRTANQGISNNEILAFPTIVGTGKTISSVVSCRVFRDPTNVGDTFTPSVWLKAADIHIEEDSVGSRTVSAK